MLKESTHINENKNDEYNVYQIICSDQELTPSDMHGTRKTTGKQTVSNPTNKCRMKPENVLSKNKSNIIQIPTVTVVTSTSPLPLYTRENRYAAGKSTRVPLLPRWGPKRTPWPRSLSGTRRAPGGNRTLWVPPALYFRERTTTPFPRRH